MILSDRDIKKVIKQKRLVFNPKLSEDQIGPASIDLKLDSVFKTFNINCLSLLDTKKGLPLDLMNVHESGDYFILHPGKFILASTAEYMRVPDDMVLRVEGKSTLARMGILVHTAGFVDPGFEGTLTLEISNQSDLPVKLYTGMYICQVAAEYLSSPAEIPYSLRKKSLYNKQIGPTAADSRNLFEKE